MKIKLKDKFYTGTDNNTVIKKMFYDIQYRLKKKELYHQSHTATEVVSEVFKDKNNSFNKIYNKAKFSNMIISDDELESAKSEYLNIRSGIKNIKNSK